MFISFQILLRVLKVINFKLIFQLVGFTLMEGIGCRILKNVCSYSCLPPAIYARLYIYIYIYIYLYADVHLGCVLDYMCTCIEMYVS